MIRWRMPNRRLLALLLAAGPAAALAGQEGASAIVHMADGSSIPLTQATLSYEYVTWKQGTPQLQAQPQRRDTGSELWLAKKTYPLQGRSLEIVYTPAERERRVAGVTRRVTV